MESGHIGVAVELNFVLESVWLLAELYINRELPKELLVPKAHIIETGFLATMLLTPQ